MPDFEADIRRDWQQAEHAVTGLFHRRAHDGQPPAGQDPYPAAAPADDQAGAPAPVTIEAAATAAQPGGNIMPNLLTELGDDVKTDLGEGLEYVGQLADRLKSIGPSVISTAEALSGTTAGKLVETVAESVIPAPYEGMLVSMVGDFVKRYGQPAASAQPTAAATAGTATAAATAAQAAPAQPQQPAQPGTATAATGPNAG